MTCWISVDYEKPPVNKEILMFFLVEECTVDYDTGETLDRYMTEYYEIGHITERNRIFIRHAEDFWYEYDDLSYWQQLTNP